MEKFPFHPPLVHFPIAFYFLELVLLILWAAKKDEHYRRFALFTFRLGYLAMMAAMLAGLKDTGGIEGLGGKVRPHFYAAMTVFCFYTLRAIFWKFGKENSTRYAFLLIASAVLGNFLVTLAGFLGGRLVYG